MSFALPTTVTIVDKYPTYIEQPIQSVGTQQPTILDLVGKYKAFRELVKIAGMEGILQDSQANLTLFVPLDLFLPTTTLKACVGSNIQEKLIPTINFETARTMVNSLIIPTVLTTTMIIQSAFTRYRTRNTINTLTMETVHCAQFEPTTYNRPPFGITINNISKILTPDVKASNGLIHIIDKFPYFLTIN